MVILTCTRVSHPDAQTAKLSAMMQRLMLLRRPAQAALSPASAQHTRAAFRTSAFSALPSASPIPRRIVAQPSAATFSAIRRAAPLPAFVQAPRTCAAASCTLPMSRACFSTSTQPVPPPSQSAASTPDSTAAPNLSAASPAVAPPPVNAPLAPPPASASTTAAIPLDAAPAPPSGLLFRLTPSSLHPYLLLARADKPVGTWLLLLPCWWGLALAAAPGSLLNVPLAALMAVGAFVMRGAGCTINDLWDRDFDRRVERTRDRPLASGAVSVPQALAFLGVQLSMGLAVVLQLNWAALCIAFCSIPLVVVYPLMKRYTHWPQLVLGLTFNFGVWVGWGAVHASWLLRASNLFGLAPNLGMLAPFYLAGVCWTIVYDTIYAHQDKVDDALIGVKSTALAFGSNSKMILSGFSAASLGLLAVGGGAAGLGPVFATIAVGGGGMHFAWLLSRVRLDERTSCHRAFLASVHFGWIVLIAIVLDRLLAQPEPHKDDKRVTKKNARARVEEARMSANTQSASTTADGALATAQLRS